MPIVRCKVQDLLQGNQIYIGIQKKIQIQQ